jgi:hypothetical protein
MVQSCVNLRKRYGRKYIIRYEESYWAERNKAGTDDPWMQIIPARFGHFCPWDGERIAASVDGHPNIAATLRRLPGVQIVQDGDFGELTVAFRPERFPAVAAIMRPYRRRKPMTPEQRVAAAERLRRNLEAKANLAVQGR